VGRVSGVEDSGQFAGSVAVEVGGSWKQIFAVVVFGDPEQPPMVASSCFGDE